MQETAIEDDELQGGFTVAGPISDSLGYRLTGFYAWDDGFIASRLSEDHLQELRLDKLRSMLGIAAVNFKQGDQRLAIIDTPLQA